MALALSHSPPTDGTRPARSLALTSRPARWVAFARRALGVLVALGLCAAGASAWAQARPAGVQLQVVAEGVWFVQGEAALGTSANRNFISNAGVVVTPAGVVVIDALGSPALAEELLQAIAGVTTLPVKAVIVTHYHADHIYGLQVFKDRGAQIIGHAAGREYLNSENAALRLVASREELFPWVNDQTRLQAADRWVTGSDSFELGGERFALRHAGPAHTPEDLVVVHERSGVMFSGDLVFRGRIPFVGQADSSHWIQSLGELMALKPHVVVPGHGPLSHSPQEDLRFTRDYLLHLRKTMGEAAADLEPFEEAYARTDWSAYAGMPLFRAANRMNAYNTFLLLEQTGGK